MSEMKLSSRHRIRNSNPGGLRPSTLPLGHRDSPQYEFCEWMEKKHVCFFQTAETGKQIPNCPIKTRTESVRGEGGDIESPSARLAQY